MESYSCNLVTTFLEHEAIAFQYNSPDIGYGFVEHGVRIALQDHLSLSVQTHPTIAGSAFAESFLQIEDAATDEFSAYDDEELGYDEDVRRFATPEDLFEHIREVQCRNGIMETESVVDDTP